MALESTNRARLIRISIVMAGIISLLWVTKVWMTDSESFESVATRVLDQARKAAGRLGFAKTSSYFEKEYFDSYIRDLDNAADAGRIVKKIDFVNQNADYGGVGILVRQWAPTNDVRIIFTSVSPQHLSIFVRASDAGVVSNFLDSLTMDEMSPFE